jgi:hypothetical protein
MTAVLAFALTNAVIAAAAFAVIVVCRSRIRNPAVLHLLCVLVLLKLVTPPLWHPELAVLPGARAAVDRAADSADSHSGIDSPVSGADQVYQATTLAAPPHEPPAPANATMQERVTIDPPAVPFESRAVARFVLSPMVLLTSVWGIGTVLIGGLAGWGSGSRGRSISAGQPGVSVCSRCEQPAGAEV